MARIRDYLQDDDKPFGVGTFTLDDGTEYYLDDPERARTFLEEVERESTNIAERGSVDRTGEELEGRQKYENAVAKLAGVPEPNEPFRGVETGPSERRRAVAGPGGGEELMSVEPEREELVSRAPTERHETEGPPAPPAAPLTPAQLDEAEAARRYAQAAALTPGRTRGTDPRTLGPGIRQDQSYSRKGGMSPELYEQQAQDRASAFDATNQTVAQHYREDQAAADSQVELLRAQAIEQKKANDAQALALQRKEQKYSDDRQWLEKDVDTFYDKAKPDANRLFKERGVFGNIVQAIAQFMGAYASVISGSPNFANQILDRKIQRDVDDQMEDFRRGKMKRDGQLARMTERGMGIDQMKSALRLQQELVVQKEVKAAALREGTREAKQAAEALLMERQERFIAEENKFRTEALGEETVSGQMVRPTGGRALTPLERQQEINKLLGAQVEGEFLARGGAPAERAAERDMKREESGVKREESTERRRAEYGNKRGTIAPAANEAQEAMATIERIQKKHGGALPGIGLLDVGRSSKARKAGSVVGSDYMKDAGELRNAVQILRDAAVRANAGTQTEGDVQRESDALAGEDLSEEQLIKGARRLVERATTPLTELDATYSDVKGRQDQERDKAKYEAYRKRREEDERRRRGTDY
jgi:hypothetical protein